jgi:hypothetical protein
MEFWKTPLDKLLNKAVKLMNCSKVQTSCKDTDSVNGPGSSVGIATGYGLGGPGIESWWRRDFSHKSRPALGPTQVFPGGKAAGAWCWAPTPSSAEVTKG